jgi:hypothetical protein
VGTNFCSAFTNSNSVVVTANSQNDALFFGGMYGMGTNGSTIINFTNPATNLSTCLGDYEHQNVLGTSWVDFPATLCSKAPTANTNALLDFGGMFSYGYDNPLTHGPTCPQGFNATQVLGAYGVDWGLFYCHRPRNTAVRPVAYFGGMYGYGFTQPGYANPATGTFACPSGYTTQQAYGSPPLAEFPGDYNLFYCYRTL